MEKWKGKLALVTGASVGIGYVIAQTLVENGIKVVGLSRRTDKIEELSRKLSSSNLGKLIGLKCDICKEEDVVRAVKWASDNHGPIHILVNSACVLKVGSLSDGVTEDWKKMFDVNVLALCALTREVIKVMKQDSVDGHILNINSVSGHQVPHFKKNNFNLFPATKFALSAITEILRQELRNHERKIKVTSLSLGSLKVEYRDDCSENGDLTEYGPHLRAEDVSEAIVYVLSTSPNVQIQELTISALSDS